MTPVKSIARVLEFHKTFGHYIGLAPQVPSQKTVNFRSDFIKEELGELQEAVNTNNLIESADAIGDIQYVLDGLWIESGLQNHKDDILAEIHRSNMTKVCTSYEQARITADYYENEENIPCVVETIGKYYVVKRVSDLKVLKSLSYEKPNLYKILFPEKH